jgi:hypothetical protein
VTILNGELFLPARRKQRERYVGVDSRFAQARTIYGLTSDIFVVYETDDNTIIVGGLGVGSSRWTQRLTAQAAHQLWSILTRLLFPEKSRHVLGMAKTAPLCAPVPELTTRFEIMRNPDLHVYDILGWIGDEAWWCRVDYHTARRLWAALDVALYPAGWAGPVTLHGKLH